MKADGYEVFGHFCEKDAVDNHKKTFKIEEGTGRLTEGDESEFQKFCEKNTKTTSKQQHWS